MTYSVRGCDLGYEEHDGFRYCFAHGGFRNPGATVSWCDRAPTPSDTELPGMWQPADFEGGAPDEHRGPNWTRQSHDRP